MRIFCRRQGDRPLCLLKQRGQKKTKACLLFAVDLLGEFVNLLGAEGAVGAGVGGGVEFRDGGDQLISCADVRHVHDGAEGRQHLHLPENFLPTRGANDEQPAAL